MKKLIPIMLILLLSACETTTTWLVTTTVRVQKWNTTTVTKFYDQSTSSTELITDMSKKEIEEYCQPQYYTEQYGTTLYKYFTTKTYEEAK